MSTEQPKGQFTEKEKEQKYELSDPWFSLLCMGVSDVICRPDTGCWETIKPQDYVTFWNNELGSTRLKMFKVVRVRKFIDFRTALITIGIQKCYPTVIEMDDVRRIVDGMYTEAERIHGAAVVYFTPVSHRYIDTQKMKTGHTMNQCDNW